METKGILPPVSRKKTRLDPITPDVFRRSSSNFGVSDNTKIMQALAEENEQLKKELEEARKEIFRLKEENFQLKKESRGTAPKGSTTFLTSATNFHQNGDAHEEGKKDSGDLIWSNCNNSIAAQNYKLHVIYCEKNLTECSYWKVKLNRKDLDAHIEDERGDYPDLLEAVTNGKNSDIQTMYEHGNDIFALDSTDSSNNTLLHVAVRNMHRDTVELLIKLGIDVNAKNKNNETPLHHAVALKDQDKAVEIVDLMLWKGADPYLKDKLGDTPAAKAKRLGKSNIVLLFSSAGDERVMTPSMAFRK